MTSGCAPTPSSDDEPLDFEVRDADLLDALNLGQLRVVYQPTVSLADGTITGVEALMRWDHPELGSVPPAVFVPLAEHSRAIVALGDWSLNEACRTVAAWNHEHPVNPLHVAVNVSAVQLHDPVFPSRVKAALRASGLAAPSLELEITESLYVDDDHATVAGLADLHRIGVRMAMDDFGTGYSSLSYLNRLPLDVVKIDRALVQGVPRDDRASTLLAALVSLLHSLGFSVVVEGVETQEEATAICAMGVDTMQGFYFSRPMDDLEEIIAVQDAVYELRRVCSPTAPDVSFTVVVVDDDPITLQLARYLLTFMSGARVLTASSGNELDAILDGECPDLVLLDIRMPGRSGLAVARDLRRRAGLRIPIVAMTAYPEQVLDHGGRDSDAFSGLIAKPFEPRTFAAEVSGYLLPGKWS